MIPPELEELLQNDLLNLRNYYFLQSCQALSGLIDPRITHVSIEFIIDPYNDREYRQLVFWFETPFYEELKPALLENFNDFVGELEALLFWPVTIELSCRIVGLRESPHGSCQVYGMKRTPDYLEE